MKFDITVPDIYEPIDESIVVNKNDVIDVDQVIKKLIEVYIWHCPNQMTRPHFPFFKVFLEVLFFSICFIG